MKLEIVWHNPMPPRAIKRRVELIAIDEFGALYSVIDLDRKTAFELIPGGAA